MNKDRSQFGWKLRGKRLAARCVSCRAANYKENPQRARDRAKAYYDANRAVILQRERAQRKVDVEKMLWQSARRRARDDGLEFSIEEWEVCVPQYCPVFGKPLSVNDATVGPWSPTLDRIDSTKGYVRGNIIVVSHKANTMKSDATVKEIRRLARFYTDLIRSEK